MSQIQGLILIQGIYCGNDLVVFHILDCNMRQDQGLNLIKGICFL